MAKYQYIAKTMEGKKMRGVMEAPDEMELYNRLRTDGMFLVSSTLADGGKKGKRIKAKDLAEFCRELGTLLQAGVSLIRALNIIAQEETIKPWQRIIYQKVTVLIRQGVALSDAMEQQEGVFPELMLNMLRSAEMSGNMDQVALRLANHYEKDYRLNSKVVSAMIYPIILLVACVGAVIALVTFVLPMFSDLFAMMDALPLPTRIVLGISDVFRNHWIIVIGAVVILFILFKMIFAIPSVHLWKDKVKLRLPVVGKLLSTIYTARFTRTLSSLYSSGLPIISALQVGRRTVGNAYLESQFDEAISIVRGGGKLSEALSTIEGFTKRLPSSVMIGEETGSLDSMLNSISDDLDYMAEVSIARLVALLEPVMIIVMGLVVGFILLSVMLPIIGSYGAIENSGNVY